MWRSDATALLLATLLATIVAGCGPAAHPGTGRGAGRGARRTAVAGGTAAPAPGSGIAGTDSAPGDAAPGDTAPGDAVAARRAILRTVSEYVRASNAGDVSALVGLYTDDALVLPPAQPPVEGRRRIAAFWRHGLDSGFALTPVRIDVHGDVAYVVGRYTLPATDEDPADSGKTVFCLRRAADGSWRVAADMWNTDAGADDTTDAGDDVDDRTFTPET